MAKEIFTTSFPKSGSTWLWRILSDLLYAPMQEKPDQPMHTQFAREIRNDYIIRKTHMHRHEYSGIGYYGEPSQVVWIYRDPRDMLVSTMYYRKHSSIEESIAHIAKAKYAQFVDGWLENPPDCAVRYEDLHIRPDAVITRLYHTITGQWIRVTDAREVIYRQQFHNWHDLDPTLLRKGIIGDWKFHFDRTLGMIFEENFGEQLRLLDYEKGNDWWKSLPERFGSLAHQSQEIHG